MRKYRVIKKNEKYEAQLFIESVNDWASFSNPLDTLEQAVAEIDENERLILAREAGQEEIVYEREVIPEEQQPVDGSEVSLLY